LPTRHGSLISKCDFKDSSIACRIDRLPSWLLSMDSTRAPSIAEFEADRLPFQLRRHVAYRAWAPTVCATSDLTRGSGCSTCRPTTEGRDDRRRKTGEVADGGSHEASLSLPVVLVGEEEPSGVVAGMRGPSA